MTGLSANDPIAWFTSSSFTTTATRHLFANPQGSIVLAGDSAGNAVRLFAYDEYGVPTTSGGTAQLTAANGARFGYTGQAWIPELGMYHYKHVLSACLGRQSKGRGSIRPAVYRAIFAQLRNQTIVLFSKIMLSFARIVIFSVLHSH